MKEPVGVVSLLWLLMGNCSSLSQGEMPEIVKMTLEVVGEIIVAEAIAFQPSLLGPVNIMNLLVDAAELDGQRLVSRGGLTSAQCILRRVSAWSSNEGETIHTCLVLVLVKETIYFLTMTSPLLLSTDSMRSSDVVS